MWLSRLTPELYAEQKVAHLFGAIKCLAYFHKIQLKQTQHVLASNRSSFNLLSHTCHRCGNVRSNMGSNLRADEVARAASRTNVKFGRKLARHAGKHKPNMHLLTGCMAGSYAQGSHRHVPCSPVTDVEWHSMKRKYAAVEANAASKQVRGRVSRQFGISHFSVRELPVCALLRQDECLLHCKNQVVKCMHHC